MWTLLLNFLGGPIINGILQAYKARLQSIDNDDQRALELLQKEVDADIAARAEATKLLIAEQGHWYTAIVRPLLALPFIIYAWKIVLWDKVLNLGSTDDLSANFWTVFQTIIVAYFGATAIERVGRIFKR